MTSSLFFYAIWATGAVIVILNLIYYYHKDEFTVDNAGEGIALIILILFWPIMVPLVGGSVIWDHYKEKKARAKFLKEQEIQERAEKIARLYLLYRDSKTEPFEDNFFN